MKKNIKKLNVNYVMYSIRSKLTHKNRNRRRTLTCIFKRGQG